MKLLHKYVGLKVRQNSLICPSASSVLQLTTGLESEESIKLTKN